MRRIFYTIIILTIISCKPNRLLYEITTDSMSPAINPGDFVLVDSTVNTFTYGDIVIYAHKNDEKSEGFNGIFRIVGLPEDSIAVKDDICIINGIKQSRFIGMIDILDEIEETLPNNIKIRILYIQLRSGSDDQKAIKIPQNNYFMLGDNRTGTLDSRYFGPIHKDRIMGKVIKVIKGDE